MKTKKNMKINKTIKKEFSLKTKKQKFVLIVRETKKV